MDDAAHDPLPSFLTVDRSLGITGAWDLFHKLEWELLHFKELSRCDYTLEDSDRLPLRRPLWAAINAASTAWALVEWVWREAEADASVKARLLKKTGLAEGTNLPAFKEWARTFRPLEACHQISHQAKHCVLTRLNPVFKTTVQLQFIRSETNPEGGWRQTGYAVWTGGVRDSEVQMTNVFARVHQWWEEMLKDLQVVERTIGFDEDD